VFKTGSRKYAYS